MAERRPTYADMPNWALGGSRPRPSINAQGWPKGTGRTADIIEACGLELLEVADWEGLPVPERRWIVPEWIPMHGVTLIAGKGGTGKSLMVQQWLSAIATGSAFMGLRSTEPFPCVYVNCEDVAEELHRRQVAIANAMGRSLGGFRDCMAIAPRIGADNALGVMDDKGKFHPSDLYQALRSACLRNRIRGLGLDNAMQTFVGNPSDNGQVTNFLNALTRLAIDIDGFVMLVAHTAKTDGSEFMGCMAWENGVRSRLYLARESDEDETSNVRILSRNKANMAAIGARIEMEWRAGAFHPVNAAAGRSAEADAERAFLQCLDAATEAWRNVSDRPSAAFAPKIFASMKAGRATGQKALTAAMHRLFDKGEIVANARLWRDERNRRDVFGIARADQQLSAQTPAQTPAQTLCADRANHSAQTRAHTPLYTTYISPVGPEGPPPGNDDPYSEWRERDAAIAEEMGWDAADA